MEVKGGSNKGRYWVMKQVVCQLAVRWVGAHRVIITGISEESEDDEKLLRSYRKTVHK
jgi:hypothetical protein